jgi:hypothetical protein
MEGLGAAPAMAPDAQGRGKTHSGSAPESGIMEFKKLQHFIRSLNGRPRYLLIRLSGNPFESLTHSGGGNANRLALQARSTPPCRGFPCLKLTPTT